MTESQGIALLQAGYLIKCQQCGENEGKELGIASNVNHRIFGWCSVIMCRECYEALPIMAQAVKGPHSIRKEARFICY